MKMVPLDIECVKKFFFLFSRAKHMLWVLKRAPKTFVKIGLKENNYNFEFKKFLYLGLCIACLKNNLTHYDKAK